MKLIKIIPILLLVSICIGANIKAQESSNKKIVMLGNSITFQGKWEEVLDRTDVANRGIPGYTTGQLIWTIKNGLHDHLNSKIWFLEDGINDISLGVPVERIFENYKTTVDSLLHNPWGEAVKKVLAKYKI